MEIVNLSQCILSFHGFTTSPNSCEFGEVVKPHKYPTSNIIFSIEFALSLKILKN